MIYFFRHAETEWNKLGRLHGTKDAPLTDFGKRQFEKVCLNYKANTTINDTVTLYVSPQKRAVESANIFASIISSVVHIDNRLKEVSLGSWDGLTLEEISQLHPDMHFSANNDWFFLSPDGEKLECVKNRIVSWYAEIAHKNICAISHGIVGRVFTGIYLGLPDEKLLSPRMPQNKYYKFHDGAVESVSIE